jgi:hypothetical protein
VKNCNVAGEIRSKQSGGLWKVVDAVDEVLNRIEQQKVEEGPEGETSLELLQTVYRDRKQPLNVRVRCAVEALAHEYPRVSAVAHTTMSGQSFAEALDRAIKRSEAPLPLPAPGPIIEHDPEELKGPMARLDRRFG